MMYRLYWPGGPTRWQNSIQTNGSYSQSVTLSNPGVVEFVLTLDVPDNPDGSPGAGYLSLTIDGKEQARWAGSELGLPVRLPVRAGGHTITWATSGAWATINDAAIKEYVPVPNVLQITNYTPPRPARQARVFTPLQGPPRVQAIERGGAVAHMAVVVKGADAYATLIEGIDRRVPLLWIDEGGRVWLGSAGEDVEVEQRGLLYFVEFDLVAQERPGVGAP